MEMFVRCSAVTGVLISVLVSNGRQDPSSSNDQAPSSPDISYTSSLPIDPLPSSPSSTPQPVLPIIQFRNLDPLKPPSQPHSQLPYPSGAPEDVLFKGQSTHLQTLPFPPIHIYIPPAPVPIYVRTTALLMYVEPPSLHQVPFSGRFLTPRLHHRPQAPSHFPPQTPHFSRYPFQVSYLHMICTGDTASTDMDSIANITVFAIIFDFCIHHLVGFTWYKEQVRYR